MTLREIQLEVAPHEDPIARWTRRERGLRAVTRILDGPDPKGVLRHDLTLLGPRERTRALVRELQEDPRIHGLEVRTLTPHALVATVAEGPGTDPAVGHPARGLLDGLEREVHAAPWPVEDGRYRPRLLHIGGDVGELLRQVQELQEGDAHGTWKVLHLGERGLDRHVDLLRRVLTPAQETLLQLAHDMGYYRSPKSCTLEDIGRQVGLTASPVHKHLRGAEAQLVTAHLDPDAPGPAPAEAGTPRWIRERTLDPRRMVELGVRTRWEGHPLVAATEAHPGTRLVLHPPARGGALLVASGPREGIGGVEDLLGEVEGPEPTVLRTARDRRVLRVERPSHPVPWSRDPNPFPRVARRFGPGTLLRPVLVEGGTAWVTFVLPRHLPVGRLLEQVEAVGEDVGWSQVALASVRSTSGAPPDPVEDPAEELTARQAEVLEIARAMGYYEAPRGCTLEDVAGTLGVSGNAVHKNLAAAERKLVRSYATSLR